MKQLLAIDQELSDAMNRLQFAAPVTHVYNPLDYAWQAHRQFVERFGQGPKEAVFIGMNPGPYGMAQTGVPFGDVGYVRDWMGIEAPVAKPPNEHPKRPIKGFELDRREVSGSRLWGWAQERFGSPEAFFERFFVLNYCPLVFMEESGRNRTPNKLPKAEQAPMNAACDKALRASFEALKPRYIIGVGAYAEKKAAAVSEGLGATIARILHPSPASPAANRGWAPQAEAQLEAIGIALPGWKGATRPRPQGRGCA